MTEVAGTLPEQPYRPDKLAFCFGAGQADGHAGLADILGAKGANLAEMARLGLPVPPGFTLRSDLALVLGVAPSIWPDPLNTALAEGLAFLEQATDRRFGDTDNPLLVSVRSGAAESMPGMLDTVLNLGLNDQTVQGLARQSNDERFAFDCYRRFVQMFSQVVLRLEAHAFEDILADFKTDIGKRRDTDLAADDWKAVLAEYQQYVLAKSGAPFPQDVATQMRLAIDAVFASWQNARARTYRTLHHLSEGGGSAVTIQAMVFGNWGAGSATGVVFTRNPSTGERCLFGEYLLNAQGEDVVAGTRTPLPLTIAARQALGEDALSLEEALPEAFARLETVCCQLEAHFKDIQDIEFTIEQHKVYLLQTRRARRSARADVRSAVEMVAEGVLDKAGAVARVDAASLGVLLHRTIAPAEGRMALIQGLPASPGAATGRLVIDPHQAARLAAAKQLVVLVREDTSPEDVHGMHGAVAIVTARGGMTSHAAVVARGMGKPCVCGASDLRIDAAAETVTIRGRELKVGDLVTVDGATGQMFEGALPMVEPELSGDFASLMSWADEFRRLRIRVNAETILEAELAHRLGAEGVGLCRIETLLFEPERLPLLRVFLTAENPRTRERALERLAPLLSGDLETLFQAFAGQPFALRLLDPALETFLPTSPEGMAALGLAIGKSEAEAASLCEDMRQIIPALGLRGARLALTHPQLMTLQVEAALKAFQASHRHKRGPSTLELMPPFVMGPADFQPLAQQLSQIVVDKLSPDLRSRVRIGTMVETPSAALSADVLSDVAQFFAFGTNDLTMLTLGLSRADLPRFQAALTAHQAMASDPFRRLETATVGQLMRHAVEAARARDPDFLIGICGDHASDPASIAWFDSLGLNYVSCPAARVPIARLAAAQAALRLTKTPKNGLD